MPNPDIDAGLIYGGKQYETMPAGTADIEGRKPIDVPLLATGYTQVLYVPFCHHMWIQIDTTDFSEGDSVDITVEGSLDNVGFDSLSMVSSTGSSTTVTISTNRTTLLYFRDANPPYVRILVEPTLASGTDPSSGVAFKAYFAILS